MDRDIVYYNPTAVTELFKRNPELKNTEADLESWGSAQTWIKYGVGLIDRTGTIPHIIKGMKPIRPLSFDLNYTSPTLTEVCRKRWDELLAFNKPINVLWSGGADSTLILTEAIKYLTKEQLQNVTVLYTRDSLAENQIFFHAVLKHYPFKLQEFLKRNMSNLYYDHNDNEIYISGEIGDQMFNGVGLDQSMANWWFSSKADVFDHEWHKLLPQGVINLMEEQIKKAPFEIKTAADFSWWFNISMKHAAMVPQIQYQTENKNVHAFFNSWDFDQWSMQYMRDASIEDKKIFKKPYNELISEIASQHYKYEFLEKKWSLWHIGMLRINRDSGTYPLVLYRDEVII